MKKLLISLTILSLLWLSLSYLRKPTDSSLRQSTDFRDTLSFEDEQPTIVPYTPITKGEWIQCQNGRTKNSCENEQSYLNVYQKFSTYLSNNQDCSQFNNYFDQINDDQFIVYPIYTQCFLNLDNQNLAFSNSCFHDYYVYIYIDCVNL